jgi:adenylate kinase
MPRPIALTGTPGTGKSSVARRLAPLRAVEVGDLAIAWGFGRRRGAAVEVDLRGLARAARSSAALRGIDVVVGHLAHLLPLRDVVVLRCHPLELTRRLGRIRRGTVRERAENVLAEATDVIRWEAAGRSRRVLQIDTSYRSVDDVAREVARFVRDRRVRRSPRIDWLSDARVTDYLLDRAP